MKLHQVLTGAANIYDDKAAIAVGSVEDYPFTAYASGCDVVILLSGFTRVQIIPGSLYGYKEVSCVDCCDTDGKIAVSYGPKVVTFRAKAASVTADHGFPFHWERSSELCLKFKITCLSWNREGQQLLIGGDYLQLWSCENNNSYPGDCSDKEEFWSCIWTCRPAVPIYMVLFSSDGQYFASIGKNDRMVKVWFENSKVNAIPSSPSRDALITFPQDLDFSFVYLAHPRSVTGFSWRKTSKHMPISSVANVLLTSCMDNICRIWSETMMNNVQAEDTGTPLPAGNYKCPKHKKQSYNPLAKHKMTSALHFHLAAMINPLNDIPLLSSMGTFSPKGHQSSFMLHWLNNKEMQFTFSAEASLGAPVLASEVPSVDVSDDSSVEEEGASSDFDILNESAENVMDEKTRLGEAGPSKMEMKTILSKKPMSSPKEEQTKPLPPPRPRTPLEYLKQLQEDNLPTTSLSTTFYSYVTCAIGQLLREWSQSHDTLIAVHPIDGSLLVWLVEWLDVQSRGQFRQPQVSFLSRIPMAIPPADANSLLPKLYVYCPRSDKIKTLRRQVHKPGSLSPRALRLKFGASSSGAQATAIMVSTHRDGALNHWKLVFADNSLFSTVVSISHVARRCGHRYPITTILAHPELPLLLSTSSHVIETGFDDSSAHDQTKPNKSQKSDDKTRIHCSELVVWRVESVSPLRQSGGVLELTRIHSGRPNAFKNLAWVPTLFSHSLLTFENHTSLPPQAVAPCACFLASDGQTYRFYQVILDARRLQSFISSHKSRTRSTLYSSGSEGSLDSLDLETPTSNIPVEAFIESIVSRQSGSNPGCILKLCSLVDSREVLQNPLLLHIFTERSIGLCPAVESEPSSDEEDSGNSKSEENFFIVGLENLPDPKDPSQMVSKIHMWNMKVTATKAENGVEDEDLFSYPEVVGNGSFCSSQQSSRSTSPLNLPLDQPVSTTISSSKVCTEQLPLPPGVFIKTATRAADKMSSSAVNPTCPAPYLFTTSCSDGKVRFWSCKQVGNEGTFKWKETIWHGDKACNQDMCLNAPGEVVSISCAYTGRLATLVKSAPEGEKGEDGLLVCVWESESSGGLDWTLEDTLKLNCNAQTDPSQVRLEWISVENGSHILTVCIQNEIFILGSASRISHLSVQGENSNLGKETWILLDSTHLASENEWQLLNRALSWARNGVLVVGLGTEMQVYSQWKVITDGTLSPSDITSYAPTATLEKVTQMTRGGARGDLVPLSTSGGSRLGLFEEASAILPILPQYHPKHLMELMNSGKLRRVRAILMHLVQCVAGEEAVRIASREHFRPRLSSISSIPRASSFSDVDSVLENVDDKEGPLTIPPVPLHALLAADKDVGYTGVWIEGTQTITSDEKDYSALFDSPGSVDSDDEFGKTSEKRRKRALTMYGSPTNGPRTFEGPVYFGLAQARLLSYQLTRKQIPGLTSIEQLELLALADTFASTKLDLEKSPADIERGLNFAKKEGEVSSGLSGLMGGPGGGGGGYATTGSIGASAGSGGDAVDDCGLRFLLAMRHHTCLLRSLPPIQRAVVEEKGLSTSYYGWAFHSESEEELLAMVPPMLRGEPTWPELRQFGVGWWVRSNDTLRRLIEKVAKAHFGLKQDPLDCALFYLSMKKKNVICGLFRSTQDTRMAKFFMNDFKVDRWRKAALKNAYQLLGMQRFEHAAAFFLLAGSLWDAVQVCMSRLHDFQLAMVLTRLNEEQSEGPNYKRVLKDCVLGSSGTTDPFLRSITNWILKDYNSALEVLILEPEDKDCPRRQYNSSAASGNPDIFNFYLFLRKHPLIKRRRFMQPEQEAKTLMKKTRPPRLARQQSISEEAFADDPLTAMERQLFFKTAHAHMNSGCPALALQVLMELPAIDVAEKPFSTGSQHPLIEETGIISDITDSMITTGTLGDYEFNTNKQSYKKNTVNVNGSGAEDLDWSQPVSSKLGGTSNDFDWSKPVSSKLGGTGLDNSSEDFDWSKPVSSNLGGTGLDNSSDDFDWSKPVSSKLNSEYLNGNEDQYQNTGSESALDGDDPDVPIEVDGNATNSKEIRFVDVIAQQMKFSAILKLLLDELHGLPAACEIADEDLRSFFMRWMEMEFAVLHKMADYGSKVNDSDVEEPTPEPTPEPGDEENQESTADKNYIAMKIDKSAKHVQWLKKNRVLLNILLNYCSLHGSSGGQLAAMNMELLLLLHEVERCRFLLSPLFVPSAGPSIPPLILAAVSTSSLLASPLGYLQSLTQDILKYLFKLQEPPSSTNPVSMVAVLNSLTGTMSDCIYQSLTGVNKDSGQHTEQTRKGRLSSSHSSSSPSSSSSHLPTSPPAKWPGVRLLLSLLATENRDNSTRLRVILTEACVAVYLSLLSVAWSTCQPNQLFRLVTNSLKSGMWGRAFGGGVKVSMQTSSGGATQADKSRPSASPTGRGRGQTDKYWNSARTRWNYKLLGQSADSIAQARAADSKPVVVEQYMPPTTTLMGYFLSKPHLSSNVGKNYDSDEDEGDSSDDEEYESEGEDEYGFPLFRTKKSTAPRDHLDHTSYGWSLMNYSISKLALNDLQKFLPDIGFELTDLPSLSPLLHSALKLLERWSQALQVKLDSFPGPPRDFISQFPVSYETFPRGGPALLRYKALLDPGNTPFRSTRSAAEPVKRLWRSLVHQESIQEMIIGYVFKADPSITRQAINDMEVIVHLFKVPITPTDQTDSVATTRDLRVVHKDTEGINSFCINQANPNVIAVATLRDVQEIDVSHILSPEPAPWTDEENEVENGESSRRSIQPDESSEFLVVHGNHSSSNMQNIVGSGPRQRILELLKRQSHGVKRMDSHPHLPYYITGSQDGSVRMWEFGHPQQITAHRTAGSCQRVTRVHFSPYGNKVGISDASGQVLLWQVSSTGTSTNNPFMTLKCHNKQTNDFVFLSSASYIATAGHSSDGNNVATWDTLVPQRSSLVHAFTCHENGAPCIAFVKGQQLLISGGRKGNICIFDLRKQQLRHTFLAHDASVKSIVVDDNEDYFISASEDGDI
ncbi:hypothetical protein QZH41_014895, partial [Actinostola sp. cb2023]